MKKHGTAGPDGSGVDLGQMAKLNQQSFETVAHIHSRMLRDGLRFQAELFDFARRRLGKNVETQDRLSRCHSVNDAVEVLNEFCTTAARDYGEEAQGLIKLCVSMAAETANENITEASENNGK